MRAGLLILAARLAGFAFTLWAASVVLFVTIAVLPGSASRAALGVDATAAAIARFEAERGLDRPVAEQYFDWMGGALRGNFGTSFQNGVAVGPDLSTRLPVTAELAFLAFIIANAIAIPLGLAAGGRPRGIADRGVTVFVALFAAVPGFLIATGLVMLFALHLAWLPPSGYVSFSADPVANLRHLAMPALALGLGTAAILLRMMRVSARGVMASEFVRAARARGASGAFLLRHHVLRNALIPYTHAAALEFSFLFGSVVVIEDIFRLPGVGQMVLVGILDRDYPVLLAGALTITAVVLAINAIADLIGAWLDPRPVSAARR